jgi:signal transduction histidine kinase
VKRLLIIVCLLVPGGLLVLFALQPRLDPVAALPLFHFYIVTFTTFTAAVISILLGMVLGRNARSRHVLAATAFAAMGSIFFSHGVATPGALIAELHPIVTWSAWVTLFVGGALFAVATLEAAAPARPIVVATVGGLLLYFAVGLFAPDWLGMLGERVEPWHRTTLFIITLALWLAAAFRWQRIWRASHNRVDGALAFVALWLAFATISMHQFPLWNFSWWLYHILLLLSFLITVYVLVVEYEHVRQFRLTYYYLAASLILTALLALAASALYTQFAYNTLVAQIQTSARDTANNLASALAGDMPEVATADDLRNFADRGKLGSVLARRLKGLSIQSVVIYDSQGVAVFASEPEWIGAKIEDRLDFEATLNEGESDVEIRPPDNPPKTYVPARDVYIAETYAPLRPSKTPNGQPISVLVTFQEIPELGETAIRARLTGLLTAALTMGLLFAALLSVVNRADKLITTRTDELALTNAKLREAQAYRDNMTQMIVHDLRNPLTAISASIELLPLIMSNPNPEHRQRVIASARSASKRISSLVDDLLDVSKIEAGELKPDYRPTPLQAFLAERINAFSAQAANEQKKLSLNCPEGLLVDLDQSLIGRVVENLLSNAFKYTERDGEIDLTVHPNGAGQVEFHLRDNGQGIPDAYKKRIFDKFIQAPITSEGRVRKGTGLGLTFCRLVVEQHGGEIWVSDAPGGGSVFTFWLPKTQNIK